MHKMKASSGPPETQQAADVPELRAEEALRISEERWRCVFENSAIGVALTDLNGHFLAANHVYQKVTGYTEEELGALCFLDLLTHEDYREANRALITELLEGKRRQFQIEKKYRRKDGSLIWVSNNVSLVPGTERLPRFIVALTEDITERKRAEQALQRSESYQAEAQRLTKTGSWAYNPAAEKAIHWSEEMLRIFGLDPQRSNLPDREEFLRLVHPEDRDRFNERIDKARREKADFVQDYRIVLPDGTVKHIHGIGHAILDETGNIIEYVGTDVDVTDRKSAEEKLRRSEAELLEAQRMSRTGSMKLDFSSGTVTVSPQVFRIFGVKPDEDTSTAEFWLSRTHLEDQKRIWELFDRSINQKTDFDEDYRIVHPDGAIKHIHSVGHPVLNESGDLVEFVGTTMDITERKQAEAFLAGEKRILEMVAKGDPLPQILDSMCRFVEEQASGFLASILLVDGNRLRHGAAPSLPKAYTDAVDGGVIGPSVGSCGTAAYRGEQVIVEDIATDPLWADYREAALPHSLRACWSTPVFSPQGKVIATFAMYYREPRSPSPHDQETIEQITHLAGVAIERKLTQEALRRSEHNLNLIINTIPALAWSARPDGSADFFNLHYLDFVGLSTEQAQDWGWTVAVHSDDLNDLAGSWQSIMASGKAGEAEARLRRADGEYRWFLFRASPLRDQNGNIVRWYGINTDIEDRKRAEDKLRRSEWSLNEAQRLGHSGSWGLDASSGIVMTSPEMIRAFDVKPGEDCSRPDFWFNRFHPEDRKWVRDLFERCVIDKTTFEAEYRLLLPDGTIKWQHSIGRPIVNVAGDLVEFVGTAMDVTEQVQARAALEKALQEIKQRNEALRRSEGYLAEAQKFTHTGSWAWNVRTGALFWSQEIFRIYNFEPQEGLTWPRFLERVHPEDRLQVEQGAKREASEKEWVDSQHDYRIVLPDGTIKHLHSVAHPVRDGSNEITEVVGTVMDVTEQWKARTELERAFEEIKRLKDQLHDENLALREQIDQAFMFEEIVGSSPALQTVLSRIVKVAPTDSTVLITGETGTGKELIARAIHKHSQRSGQAFISVNCASIPSSLIASELFGHEKGAFTGAVQRRQGRFELAHSGTIFLDEVGELPAETQIALLRVLQERQFERVGGNRLLSTDVRVIAATNRDLTAAVAAGTFRADLFYRLNVFPIEAPPLRKRKEDIPVLVEYFVKRYAEKTGKQIRKIDKNTLELCQAYPWPGNIRELQNIVERSVILCSSDTFWIEKAWLASEQPRRPELSGPLPDTLENQERKIIEAALAESKGKVAGPEGAAARLGIPRSTLDSKIKQLKIRKYKFISE